MKFLYIVSYSFDLSFHNRIILTLIIETISMNFALLLTVAAAAIVESVDNFYDNPVYTVEMQAFQAKE